MDYYFPYGDYGDSFDASDIAGAGGNGNEGACPPLMIRYRIYPEIDFALCFGNPPETVKTQ